MAEQPIRKEDIIDIEGLREELKLLIGDLTQLANLMKGDLSKSAAEFKQETEKIDVTTKEGRQAMKDRMKDITDITKQYNALNKAVDSLNKDLKQVPAIGSYNELNNRLKELRNLFKSTADEGVRNGLVPRIKELDAQLKKLDSTIGNNQRSVGNYKQAIIDAGKQLFSFGGIAGVATVVINKLKEAFISTTSGLNVFNQITEVSKQLFYDLSQGVGMNADKLQAASKIAKEMNEIRRGDMKDLVNVAKMERTISDLRFQAADKTKSETERLQLLNKAMVEANKLADYQIADKKEDLDATMKLLKLRPDDDKLKLKYHQLIATIISLDTQRTDSTRRMQTQITGFMEQANKDSQDRIDKLASAYEQDAKDYQKSLQDKMDADKKYYDNLKVLEQDRMFTVKNDSGQLVEIKYKEIQKTQEADQANAQFEKELAEEVKNEKIQDWVEDANRYIEIASGITRQFTDILEERKKKELSAVGDNAAAREKIEKEYAKKEKALAITNAIIQNATNILKALGTFPVPNIPLAAITGALGAVQIGMIASQKFAEGGYTGDGVQRDDTGERVAGVVHEREYVIPKEPTRKYRDLLEAIHQDNPMAIAEELRSRQFHTVWGGIQPKLAEVQRQDPYTRMMYDLMKNSVVTYEDTNGDTVLRFADGSTRIIRK